MHGTVYKKKRPENFTDNILRLIHSLILSKQEIRRRRIRNHFTKRQQYCAVKKTPGSMQPNRQEETTRTHVHQSLMRHCGRCNGVGG